jgi:hypothetical protein
VVAYSGFERTTSQRAFGVFQEMIRQFVDVLQRDWDTHIALLEFAYINTVNDSTGQTPFYVASDQRPPTLYDALRQAPSVQDAEVNTAAKYFVSVTVNGPINLDVNFFTREDPIGVRVPTYNCNDTCIALSGRVQRHL